MHYKLRRVQRAKGSLGTSVKSPFYEVWCVKPKENALLRAGNSDQIIAVSKVVLHVLTNDKCSIRPDLVVGLRPSRTEEKEKFRKMT